MFIHFWLFDFLDFEQLQDGHIGESEARTMFVNEAKRHLDLPIGIRDNFANNVSAVDLERPTYGPVDIPRLRTGRVGGFFWQI